MGVRCEPDSPQGLRLVSCVQGEASIVLNQGCLTPVGVRSRGYFLRVMSAQILLDLICMVIGMACVSLKPTLNRILPSFGVSAG